MSNNDPVLTPIGYDVFLADVLSLAASLDADDWQPDFLVGIGRGGLAPAAWLSHACDVALLSVDQSTGVATFGAGLLAEVARMTAAGKRVLIVDDINDSGRTIAQVRAALAEAGGNAANTRVAVLIDNIVSAERVDYSARTIDRTVTKDWFVFPWEAVADRKSILRSAAEVPERIA